MINLDQGHLFYIEKVIARSQVSVYRTIGPLVDWLFFILVGRSMENHSMLHDFNFGQIRPQTVELAAL